MPLLSVDEASKRLGLCTESVRRLIWKRQLPAVRIGTRVLVDEKDLRAFIKSRKAPAAA